MLNVLEHYEDAVPYLERAVKHTQGTPLHNGATRAYEIALQYVAFDSRQAVNATGKARWDQSCSNGQTLQLTTCLCSKGPQCVETHGEKRVG